MSEADALRKLDDATWVQLHVASLSAGQVGVIGVADGHGLGGEVYAWICQHACETLFPELLNAVMAEHTDTNRIVNTWFKHIRHRLYLAQLQKAFNVYKGGEDIPKVKQTGADLMFDILRGLEEGWPTISAEDKANAFNAAAVASAEPGTGAGAGGPLPKPVIEVPSRAAVLQARKSWDNLTKHKDFKDMCEGMSSRFRDFFVAFTQWLNDMSDEHKLSPARVEPEWAFFLWNTLGVPVTYSDPEFSNE